MKILIAEIISSFMYIIQII